MSFRDREWEDFQRDCDLLPAYTDYIFGVDTRPEAEYEPGLHPQIFELDIWPPAPTSLPPTPPAKTPLPLPAKRLYSLSHLGQCTQASAPGSQPDRLHSSNRTPPRNLPVPRPPFRPGELTMDISFSFLSHYKLTTADNNVTRAWNLINSNIPPEQKVKWTNYLAEITRQFAAKREKEAARMHSDKQKRVWDLYGHGGLTETMWKAEPSQ
ncbi:hypothetical protein G6514_000780 [Epicoccum nigrum]|nr:hypothetical protein G6514_000780 [Epicoccum nigrum]